MKEFILKRPSAWLPIALSAAALSFTLTYILVVGIPKVKNYHDEGAAAHIFQLLMGLQVPIILFFFLRWLPKKPKETTIILLLQILAGVLAFAPVYLLEL